MGTVIGQGSDGRHEAACPGYRPPRLRLAIARVPWQEGKI
jgi:hypothetical protein